MIINPVSFGKKIPIATCKVKDLQQNKFVSATMYEFDCCDLSDIREVEGKTRDWDFRTSIVHNMEHKYNCLTNPLHKRINNDAFYTIEKNNKIIGITQVTKEDPELIIEYIESEHKGEYKYVGQNLINLLGKIAFKENFKRIYVPNPIPKAYNFYVKKCGFKENKNYGSVYLAKAGIAKLQKKIKSLLRNGPAN